MANKWSVTEFVSVMLASFVLVSTVLVAISTR